MKFGLMFFASSEEALGQQEKYKLIIEAARFGDRHGFSSIWTPERHFTKFGCLYPNPAVLHAALARETGRIRLQAGSVVMPLHDPLRVAEEWAMVDNLSGGRVGVSFAAGWNPDDFAFFPERYADRHEAMYPGIRQVQQLWAGHTIEARSGTGQPIRVRTYPSPLQAELPIWITAASNPATFIKAGQIGANVLTHTLDHDNAQLAHKIALYRQARADNGHDPAAGVVSMLLHTFVGRDEAVVREQARKPYCDYMRSNIGLLKGLAHSRGQQLDLRSLSPAELDEMLNYLFDRFASVKGLIGTPETCLELVHEFAAAGVDELACLLDFGPSTELILENLPELCRLKDLYQPRAVPARPAPACTLASPTSATPTQAGPPPLDHRCLAAVRTRCGSPVEGEAFYAELSRRGFGYGTGFRGIARLWQGEAEVLAQVALPAALRAAETRFTYHPAFLDACFQVFIAALLGGGAAPDALCVPVGFRQLQAHGPLPEVAYSHAYLDGFPTDASPFYTGNLVVFSPEGVPLLEVTGFRVQVFNQAPRRPRTDALYRVNWLPVAAEGAAPPAATGERFLILADKAGAGRALARSLEKRGNPCTVLYPPEPAPSAPALLAGLEAQLANPGPSGRPVPTHLVFLWALDGATGEPTAPEDLMTRQQFVTEALLRIVQVLTRAALPAKPQLWLMTRNAQSTHPGDGPVAVGQGALWGLGRVLQTEATAIGVRLVDLAPGASGPEAAQELLTVLESAPADDQLAVRAGRYLSPRLHPAEELAVDESPLRLSPDASYLVTGGVGGLGVQLAGWLARKGARHVVLLSRREPGAEAAAHLRRIEATGCTVAVVTADVAEFAPLQAAWNRIAAAHPPVKGVFHLAGVLDDAPLAEQHAGRFAAGSRAKTAGAFHLHLLTRDLPLDHFVLFSSVSSLIGLAGQASYALGNAFLDALAHHRHALGLPALSVNWGPWSGLGHAATAYGRTAHRHLAQLGIGAWPFDEGMRVLETLLRGPAPQATALVADWTAFFGSGLRAGQSVLLKDLRETARTAGAPAGRSRTGPTELARLRQAGPEGAPALLRTYLQGLVARSLKLTAGQLDPDRPLTYLGLDSLMAIELKNRINTDLALEYSVIRFMEGISLHQLTLELQGRLAHHWTGTPAAEVEEVADDPAGAPPTAEAAEVQAAHDLLADLESLTPEQLDEVLKKISQA